MRASLTAASKFAGFLPRTKLANLPFRPETKAYNRVVSLIYAFSQATQSTGVLVNRLSLRLFFFLEHVIGTAKYKNRRFDISFTEGFFDIGHAILLTRLPFLKPVLGAADKHRFRKFEPFCFDHILVIHKRFYAPPQFRWVLSIDPVNGCGIRTLSSAMFLRTGCFGCGTGKSTGPGPGCGSTN